MWNEAETVEAPAVTPAPIEALPTTAIPSALKPNTARPEVKARRERKKQNAREQSQSQALSAAGKETSGVDVAQPSTEIIEKSPGSGEKKRSVKKIEQRREKRDKWKVSNAIGGRFIDADPVFTPDERYALRQHIMSIHS
jgi:hypothetical protein